jgi:superfamily II DNA/RNA helicase
MTQFSDLNLDPKVLQAVIDTGYLTPTPIQAGAIPAALAGRDVLGIAQTGTGKTASFVLPMITLLGRGRARARMPRSLVLCPTRELAAQVAENFDTYAKHTKLTKALLIGGVSFKEQDLLIDRGVDVLIATPGRLLDHFERGKLLLTGVQIMVVDEADRMLDMGFIPDIERIFNLTPFTRQTLFFSATMAPEIERITNTFLSNPAKIEVARAATAGENIKQGVVMFKASKRENEASEKRALLRAMIDGEGDLCTNAIIFCNRKTDVDLVAKSLKKHGYNAEPIHGDLEQSQRMRTLDGFRNGDVKFLCASDVAARGLDIPAVSHVFNFDVPTHSEDYVHRIGRTGRAGRKGTTMMICSPRDEKNFDAIEKLVQIPIPRLDNPLTNQPKPTGDVEDDGRGQAERPARSRTRSRTRKGEGETAAPIEGSTATEQAAPPARAAVAAEAAPTPDRAPATEARPVTPRAERSDRPERNDRPERGPRNDRSDRGERTDRGDRNAPRGPRETRDRREERIVGMGDDTPSFILKSFEERRG